MIQEGNEDLRVKDNTPPPPPDDDDDDGISPSFLRETDSLCSAAATKDSIWEDENGNSQEFAEARQTADDREIEQPRSEINHRVLRSAAIAASAANKESCQRHNTEVVDKETEQQEQQNAWETVPLDNAVDLTHRRILVAYNERVKNLIKLKSYLAKESYEGGVLYLYLLEEEIIRQRQVELDYLSTADAYQALDSSLSFRHRYVCQPIDPDLLKAHKRKIIKGTTVIAGKDEHGKWPLAEIVGEWIQDALKGESDQRLPHDANDPVYCDASKPEGWISVKSFLRHYDSTCSVHNISHTAKLAVLESVQRICPRLRLGLRLSTAGNIVHDYSKYLIKDWRDVTIDVCPHNCILYIGDNRWKIKCPPPCGEYRFSACCNNGNCKAGGIDCDPFQTPTHSVRSAYNILKYRQVLFQYVIIVF